MRQVREVFASLRSVLPKRQEWNNWKLAPVYTIVLFFYLSCLFFASLCVNKLKMLAFCRVAFVSFALSAHILNASLIVLSSPPKSWSLPSVNEQLEFCLGGVSLGNDPSMWDHTHHCSQLNSAWPFQHSLLPNHIITGGIPYLPKPTVSLILFRLPGLPEENMIPSEISSMSFHKTK